MGTPEKPKGFGDALGHYEPVLFDANCGEPIVWGFKILERLSPEKFEELYKFGTPVCLKLEHWALGARFITRDLAIEKYGQITDEEFGPRGGFLSVTFGEKKFVSRYLKKANETGGTVNPAVFTVTTKNGGEQ